MVVAIERLLAGILMKRNESMDQLVAVVGGVESVLEVEAHRKQLSLVVGTREDNSREDFVGLDVVQQVQDCREVVWDWVFCLR